jgi:hypothetical protein
LLYAEPGFSDVDVNDMAQAMKIKVTTAKGVLGSLVKKRVLFTDKCGSEYDLIYLDDTYWDLHPKWKGVSRSPNKPEWEYAKT